MTYFAHQAGAVACEPAMRRQVTAALAGVAQLTAVTAALERAGIGAVAIKGPALAAWLYGNAAAREFADLDIAVSEDDRLAALRVLEAEGYHLPDGMPREIAAVVYDAFGTWPLEHPSRLRLDLHWRVGYPRFAATLRGAELVTGRHSIDVGGAWIPFVSPSQAAIIALTHAAKHVWTHLEAVYALAVMTGREDIDWPLVGRRLTQARAATAGRAGMRLAAMIFGAAAPAPLAPAGTRREDRLVETACALLAAERGDSYARWAERRAHRDSLDTFTARVRYDVARLFSPTPAEWRWRPLPPRLAGCYRAVRIARIVAGQL